MSDHHNIAVAQSQWCASSSIEEDVILGLSDPVCQNGTISIYDPSDTVADLRAFFFLKRKQKFGLSVKLIFSLYSPVSSSSNSELK